MDDSNTVDNVDVNVEDDFAAFKAEFYATPSEDEAVEDKEVDAVDDADAEVVETVEDADEVEDNEVADESEEGEEEAEAEQKPHKNRKTAKERIAETIAQRNEEREAKLVEREARLRAETALQALEARLAKLEKPEPKVAPKVEVDYDFPDEDAVDESGELVYPLGKFDPKYTADVIRHVNQKDREAAAQADEQRRAEQEAQAAQSALVNEWNTKLEEKSKELPDLREKIASLETAFVGVDETLGIFLVENIMKLDRGPEVLYYLADHPSEAEAIVAASPGAALIKLGHIEGRLPTNKVEEGDKKRVSTAAAPPVSTRGTGASKRVAVDTDDLKAFKREFFKD